MHYRIATDADIPTLAQLRWDFHCEDGPPAPLEPLDQFVRTFTVFLRDGLVKIENEE
jgi:hypothetical protein